MKQIVATSKKEVGETIGVSEKTVANWILEGCPGEPRNYVLKDIIKWARENKWETDDSDGKLLESINDKELKSELVKERIEKVKRENRLADFQIDKMSASLVDVSVIEELLLLFSEKVKSSIKAVEKKHGPDSCSPVRAAIDYIVTEIENGALNCSEAD